MKFVFKLIIILLCNHCFSQSLVEIRESYLNSYKGEETIQKLLLLCKNKELPIYEAYEATANMMMIEYTSNVFHKLKIFKKNSDILDKLILKNPTNIEIRFLRYCVQYKSPSIVKNKNKMKEDHIFIMKNINKQKDTLKEYINLTLVEITSNSQK